jgi:hypothetical protein
MSIRALLPLFLATTFLTSCSHQSGQAPAADHTKRDTIENVDMQMNTVTYSYQLNPATGQLEPTMSIGTTATPNMVNFYTPGVK